MPDWLPFILIALIVFAFIAILWLVPVRLWIAARASGVKVSMLSLIAMRLRVSPRPPSSTR
jgi:uncharacterized protein YqfA (UPF0365 family)